MNPARFRLKSEAPQELWLERLALYRMAHRLGISQLCRTSLRVMAKEIEISLRSGNVTRFIRNVYDLDQEEAQSLKEEVATKIAEQEPCVVPRSELDLVLLTHPLFGCYLFKATQKKGVSQTESIKTLQMVVDRQEKEIADYSQGVKSSEHKAMVSKHKAELDKQKAELDKLKADTKKQKAELDKLKADAKKQKADLATQKTKEAKDKLELAKREGALLKQQDETDKGKRKIARLEKQLKIPQKGKSVRNQLSESESGSNE
jgi:chromosome segregation ATPase